MCLRAEGCVCTAGPIGAAIQLAPLTNVVRVTDVVVRCCPRCVSALKDVSAQLGPIGAAIHTKLATLLTDTFNCMCDIVCGGRRCVSALKDAAGQLGPIGAVIQTKLAATLTHLMHSNSCCHVAAGVCLR